MRVVNVFGTLATLASLAALGAVTGCDAAGAPRSPDGPASTPAENTVGDDGARAAPLGRSDRQRRDRRVRAFGRGFAGADPRQGSLEGCGGRRIAWSARKKRFIVPVDVQTESGRGLDLRFYDDEGQQRDILRVCQPGECEERLDDLVKSLAPKLTARLTEEGYEAIYSVGWPSGRDEIDVSAVGGRLRYQGGRLTLARAKKPPVSLRSLGGRSPKTDELAAVYPVPEAKLLAVFAGEALRLQAAVAPEPLPVSALGLCVALLRSDNRPVSVSFRSHFRVPPRPPLCYGGNEISSWFQSAPNDSSLAAPPLPQGACWSLLRSA